MRIEVRVAVGGGGVVWDVLGDGWGRGFGGFACGFLVGGGFLESEGGGREGAETGAEVVLAGVADEGGGWAEVLCA